MKVADTISVNPGKTTLGEKSSPSAGILRVPVLDRQKRTSGLNLSVLLCPSTNQGLAEYKKFALPLRALFATILIVAGLTLFQSPLPTVSYSLGILEIIFGGLLAVGFLTRPIMGCAGVYFGIMAALSLRNGIADITPLCLMFGSFLFCATGSGKYSLDFLIKNAIRNHVRFRNEKKKNEMMGYKAFHYAKY